MIKYILNSLALFDIDEKKKHFPIHDYKSKYRIHLLQETVEEDCVVLLIGNKVDQIGPMCDRVITEKDGIELAKVYIKFSMFLN